MKPKQFQCEECKDWSPTYKKAWYQGKIVCQRCFFRLKQNNKMVINGIKERMLGV